MNPSETKRPEAIILLFDGAGGIYIPQRFANEIDRSKVSNVSKEDYAILEAGPEHEDYWEAWDDVTQDAELTLDGNTYALHSDGELFAVCPILMSPNEYEEFYGECPPRDWYKEYADRHNLMLYALPTYAASYLVNNDPSGIEDTERENIDAFIEQERLGACVDVSSEPFFSYSNDLTDLGGDCAYYLFEKYEEDK